MLNKKIALITGANKGIGFEIAKQLGEKNHTILVSGRSMAKLEQAQQALKAKGIDAHTLHLDLTNEETISQAAKHVEQFFGRLDILINNAAIRIEEYGKLPSQQPISQWIETFNTNLFGTVMVTHYFLPLLKQSQSGRIINVSSLLGSVTIHSDRTAYTYSSEFKSLPAYSASKSALNSWTVHLAYELRNTPITVNSVHPGYTKTDLNDGAGELESKEGALSAVQMALNEDSTVNGLFLHKNTPIPW